MEHILSHKYDFGKVYYTDEGIQFAPMFSKNTLTISWSNIEFVSPTPGVGKNNGQWETYNSINLEGDGALERLNFLYIELLLKNRFLPKEKLSLWQSILLYMGIPDIKPTTGVNNKKEPYEGFLQYQIKKRSLSQPLSHLLHFIEQKNQFGLLCHTSE